MKKNTKGVAVRRSKCSSSNASSKSITKKFMLSAVQVIAEQIVQLKKRNGGKLPYGEFSKLWNAGKATYPNMSRKTINNYVKKIESGGNNNLPKVINANEHASKVSNLTGSTSGEAGGTSDTSSTRSSSMNSETKSIISQKSFSTIGLQDKNEVVGGQPKGSTIQAATERTKNIELATHDAVASLSEFMSKKKKGQRLENGLLSKIIADSKSKYNLDEEVIILETTVWQRVKRKSNSGKLGRCSPMQDIEPYIVSIIIQLANMRVPISSSQGLSLCNSIIEGTKFQDAVVEYKKKYCRSVTEKLGQSYWRGFLRRNKHLIRAKKTVKFETKRSEWCTYQNMKEMYTEVYSHLVESGLAVKHSEPVWRNKEGEVVEKEQAVGLQSEYELIHPEWLVFVDEVGSNTSQTKDGHVGGETYLCAADGRPQQ